ncbi:class I SAM-dependent methyltransferase [Thiohalophilus thiocyanatoxydans]|uniref:Putative O-methyltransferase YrrM n=1 Tax=Thiohalophilus thiocyanatoxydans TaxID=381308 RepID=A0A4R8IJL1_9GAMM|nr:class I SAM-dependent methyltransferase [Thiohalophilus thiocyanatoxydans]TDY00922.1 putative O-methyltransferase YrrM [Thiohalophilus thiocyanatoxydans]
MSNRTLNLNDTVYDYLLAHSLRESALLKQLREETATLEMARMQISPEQGQFLNLLIKLLGARQAIEVGVFTGYSALCIADALPADGRLVACDINREWTDMAQRYWREAGVNQKIELLLAPADKTLQKLIDHGNANSFDFAFIDADKTHYLTYYEQCLKLIRKGGIIAIDNTLWSGHVADPDVNDEDTVAIRDVNDALHSDSRVDISLLPIGDGLTLALKR